jgi:hypothetical protein
MQLPSTISHRRDLRFDQIFRSLFSRGETMTTSAMAAYSYDEIRRTRTE